MTGSTGGWNERGCFRGDRTVRIYVLPKDLLALARTRVTCSLTDEERQQYLHVEQCPEGEALWQE